MSERTKILIGLVPINVEPTACSLLLASFMFDVRIRKTFSLRSSRSARGAAFEAALMCSDIINTHTQTKGCDNVVDVFSVCADLSSISEAHSTD